MNPHHGTFVIHMLAVVAQSGLHNQSKIRPLPSESDLPVEI